MEIKVTTIRNINGTWYIKIPSNIAKMYEKELNSKTFYNVLLEVSGYENL